MFTNHFPHCFRMGLRSLGVLVLSGFLAAPALAGPCLGLGPTVKWSQCPDLATSFDIASNNHIGPGGPVPGFGDLVADDFKSDGRPITDVHWWGSYLGNEIIPPEAFWIGFWSDLVGADPSQPDKLLKSYVIPFPATHEEPFGLQDRFPETCVDLDPSGKCHAFQYFVDLPTPFFEVHDTIYWISIQALSSPTWGWKSAGVHQFRDDAVLATGYCAAPPCVPLVPGTPWPVPPGGFIKLVDPDNNNLSIDMAFELTTVPEPGTLLLLTLGVLGMVSFRVIARLQ